MANQNPFPLMPPRSTELRLDHFDEYAYKGDSTTTLYKYVDGLCGTTGAGSLINEIFMARLGGALETIYFNELDYIFSHVSFLARSPAESYPWNPLKDMLTSDQWDIVRIRDSWYRDRIKKFFIACGYGGSPQGIRTCVDAALGVDADIFEIWRYADNFGLASDIGRAPSPARNEVVVRPHKDSLDPIEMRLVREMLSRICPIDSIVTVTSNGLAVATPVEIAAATADSNYFEVQKVVTATPVLASLPAPELLAIDLLPTEKWMFSGDDALAPYAAFNITQEFGYYYLVGGGKRSPIDSVFYGTILESQPKITVIEVSDQFYPGVQKPNYGTWPQNSWLSVGLSDTLFNYVNIEYPKINFPLKNSIEECRQKIRQVINDTPGTFILVGHSLGAAAISQVYKDLKTGDLSSRGRDLLGGFTFGNPERETGHSIPDVDPGGHGVDLYANRLRQTAGLWWDFAIPHDFITTVTGNDTEVYTSIYNWVATTYTGLFSHMAVQMGDFGVPEEFSQSFIDTLFGYGGDHRLAPDRPHWDYATYRPIGGDLRSCFQIALDRIKQIAQENPPEFTNTVKRESNYEVFSSVGTYTDWIPYEKADCPSNFPGGKWGIHPDTAPALNADGSRYRYSWSNQAEFIDYEIIRVTKLGGIADRDHYKMPIQRESQARLVFVPENAIAYSPPSKDSTVSKSLTNRRGRTYGGELRDQSIFVRA